MAFRTVPVRTSRGNTRGHSVAINQIDFVIDRSPGEGVIQVEIPHGHEAERERQALIILGQAETEISEKFSQAALTYQNNPVALHLRAMNMLYEAIKKRGLMVIVPSSAVETMGLGGTLATASLAGAKPA